MLELKEIVKAYQTASLVQVALNKVSVAFRDNEFVAVLGQSGSGKTTMLNVIGGLDRFQAGDLVIDGISTKDYKARDWDAYRNNRIGFVFQAYNLVPYLTVRENITISDTLAGRRPDSIRVREVLAGLGLESRADAVATTLSGGEQQRVALGRVLYRRPPVVFADEPTGNLDSNSGAEVLRLLRAAATDHAQTILMVTHDANAASYADRVVFIKDGMVAGEMIEPTYDAVLGAMAQLEGR